MGTWVFQQSNYYYTSSDAFEFALKAGINLINTFNDSNGDTSFDRYAYNQFVLDPTFRSRTLKDCQYGILRRHISAAEAKILLPGKKDYINSIDEPAGEANQDEAKAKADDMDVSIVLMEEVLSLRKLLAKHGITSDENASE